MGWVVNATPRRFITLPPHPPERGPRQVWTDAKNLSPTGIRPPDSPALASPYTNYVIPTHI
jgi:hypothetical protein